MDIRILGPLEVERDGELLSLGGHKQRAVLALLILRAGEAVTTDRLIDALWEGSPPDSADTTLRGYISNLRKALGKEHGRQLLRRTQTGYLLDADAERIDAKRFERLVEEGRERRDAGDLHESIGAWTSALELWRGDALQDFAYDDFAQTTAARLTELKLTCTEDLFEAQLEFGRHGSIAGDIEAFSAEHPTRERALRLRMLALYRCGRQADALTAYEQGRRRLAENLGVDPSPELQDLHERILRQDPSLTASAAAAPSGKQTLTFLLGDVERSTEKLRVLGDEYGGVLEEHRRLLLEAFAAHGGRTVRTWGDGVFAAFDGATDAVNAAVATQLALCGAGFGEERTLAVRMGLHTGEATFTGGEPVGLSIHLASRIMDAAHGGQVLVSQATKELVEAEEGAAVTFLDTGTHALKDFPDVVRLFQVVHPELRHDFPPLRTRSGHTNNLPSRLKTFVGRERDVEEVGAELSEARVVTLTGVGGVGKTTLAIEVGRSVVSRYPDGVWLCELAPIGDAEVLVRSIASTLGVQQQPRLSPRDGLLAALAQRKTMLILDNCEHLLGPVAELAEEVLVRSAGVDLLATSREALGVDGERSIPVRSLDTDATAEAVQLFCHRARSVRPDFVVDESNRADIAEICRHLDGIPLAIELAAARVTAMSPAQIAARLAEGFRFLRSGRRTAVDRHRTLQGAIDWSYEPLTEHEQRLFERLSVFAGSFSLEAAEAVCGHDLDIDVADGLASLVAKSMVEADVTGPEARYTLLETLRQYGQDKLTAHGEAEATLRAHAVYFTELAEQAHDEIEFGTRVDFRRIQTEFDNLRAAFEWVIGVQDTDIALRIVASTMWLMITHLAVEVVTWAEQAVLLPGAPEHHRYPTVLALIAEGRENAGDFEGAGRVAREALELVPDPDDDRRLSPMMQLAVNALFEGRLDEARSIVDEVVPLARRTRHVRSEFLALGVGALADAYGGKFRRAIEEAESCVERARVLDEGLQGFALYVLGEVLGAEGSDPERAIQCLNRAIEDAEAAGSPFTAAIALVSVSSLRARHGNPYEALEMFGPVIDHWRLAGNWNHQWTTLRNLIELFCRLGIDEPAAVILAASETSSTKPTFGQEAERLAQLKSELEDRLGDAAFARAVEHGRTMADEEVVAYAKTEIGRALALDEAGADSPVGL